jgi:hypothetical protein
MSHFIPNHAGKPKETSDDGGFHQEMPSELDVVQDGHAMKELHFLEGPGDAEDGHRMGLEAFQGFPFEADLPLLRLLVHVDAVEEAGFSCAVWADDAENFPPFYGQTDVTENPHAPEGKVQIFNLEQGVFPWCRHSHRFRLL